MELGTRFSSNQIGSQCTYLGANCFDGDDDGGFGGVFLFFSVGDGGVPVIVVLAVVVAMVFLLR